MVARQKFLGMLGLLLISLVGCQTTLIPIPKNTVLPPTSSPVPTNASFPTTTPIPSFDREVETRAVYATAMVDERHGGAAFIADSTIPLDTFDTFGTLTSEQTQNTLQKIARAATADLVVDFYDITREQALFPTDISTSKTYEVVKIQHTYDFEALSDTYGTVVYRGYSRVGFNTEGTKALIYTALYCTGECGDGNILFLQKIEGVWYLINVYRIWIS